jgi:hypothetical protein
MNGFGARNYRRVPRDIPLQHVGVVAGSPATIAGLGASQSSSVARGDEGETSMPVQNVGAACSSLTGALVWMSTGT